MTDDGRNSKLQNQIPNEYTAVQTSQVLKTCEVLPKGWKETLNAESLFLRSVVR